jgi:DNA-nicking Smr family endonuclease
MLSLDLHGIKHSEAPREIDLFIWQAMQKDHTHAEIITGHSEKMKAIVNETIKDYGMKCVNTVYNEGSLLICLK